MSHQEIALINKILPEEVLEKVFSFTSQYRDYNNISLVCVKWRRIISGLRKLNKKNFLDSLENGRIRWKCLRNNNNLSPAQRHSHSTARIGDKLYVFGGLSNASTSYNDLWMFDLNDKIWSRPNISGSSPSPKAAASLLPFQNKSLILYGGYSRPYSYSFNQQVNFFDELHIYSMNKETFVCSQILFSQDTPKLAGHTASLIDKNKMLLFGGCNGSLGNKINDVFCLELDNYNWINVYYTNQMNTNEYKKDNLNIFNKREINGLCPEPRYGHSQITLDDERILIIGGCGGPNKQFDDIWILNWPKNYSFNASWQRIVILNQINSPSQLYCISFIRYENKLVTLGKPRVSEDKSISLISTSNHYNYVTSEVQPLVKYSKTKKFELRRCSCLSSSDTCIYNSNDDMIEKQTLLKKFNYLSNSSAIHSSDENLTESDKSLADKYQSNQNKIDEIVNSKGILNKCQQNTVNRLEALQKISSKFNKLKDVKETKLIHQKKFTNSWKNPINKCIIHSKVMQTFILDLDGLFQNNKNDVSSNYCSNQFVAWKPPIAEFLDAPSDCILFSLNYGINEIIVFGGMELESKKLIKNRISNKLYIMNPIGLNFT